MANKLTLQSVFDQISQGMVTAEASLSGMLANLPTGSGLSVTDMVNLQYKMSVFTITAQTMSAVMKDMSDTMKSVVQKIS